MKYFEATNLSKSFKEKKVIENVSITLNEGECVSLLGVSGIGKTTIFNILAGFLKPDQGRVKLKDMDITGQLGKLSYMQQEDLLLEHKTILDNVALPLIISGENKSLAKARARSYFGTFGLDGTYDKYPCQLSGGMRQRAALLRTYLFSNDLILLDEPFSALDTLTKSGMHRCFMDIMKEVRATTLFITHDIDEAIYLSDRIYILSGNPGRISREVSLKGLVKDSTLFYSPEYMDMKREIIGAL